MKVFTIGRFQPYNLMHEEVFERMKEFGEVAVGLLVNKLTYDNPFTYEERKEMISEDVDKIFPVPFPPNLFRMRSQLLSEVDDSTFYTRDKDAKILLEIFGFPTIYEKRRGYSSSMIRKKIFRGDESWKTMVNDRTAEIIERHEVQERLRKLKRLPFGKFGKYVDPLLSSLFPAE